MLNINAMKINKEKTDFFYLNMKFFLTFNTSSFKIKYTLCHIGSSQCGSSSSFGSLTLTEMKEKYINKLFI